MNRVAANALMSVQILPQTPDGSSLIPYVDQAISLIKASGLAYQVSPLETTIEGDLHELLTLLADLNLEMSVLGCPSVISQVKLYYSQIEGASMARLLEKYPDGK